MKMDFKNLAGEIVQFDSLFSNTALVVSGIIILVITVPILLLFIIKRKKRANESSILIYHNKLKELQQNCDNWQKGKNRIEKILYEITENVLPVDHPDPITEVPNNSGTLNYEIPVYGYHHKILKEHNTQVKRHNNISTPLDIQELKDVASLAKRLRARARHSVGT